MKHGVGSRTLLLLAGAVWIAAGANILRIGLSTWFRHGPPAAVGIAEAAAVFVVFFFVMFGRVYLRNSRRIMDKGEGPRCPFSFFDVRGWAVMLGMIGLGIVVRRCGAASDGFIAVFYTGLSTALVLTGLRFVRRWRREGHPSACRPVPDGTGAACSPPPPARRRRTP